MYGRHCLPYIELKHIFCMVRGILRQLQEILDGPFTTKIIIKSYNDVTQIGIISIRFDSMNNG